MRQSRRVWRHLVPQEASRSESTLHTATPVELCFFVLKVVFRLSNHSTKSFQLAGKSKATMDDEGDCANDCAQAAAAYRTYRISDVYRMY